MQEAGTWALVVNEERARILPFPESSDTPGIDEIVLRSPNVHLKRTIGVMNAPQTEVTNGRKLAADYRKVDRQSDMQAFGRLIAETVARNFKDGQFSHLAIFSSESMLTYLEDFLPAKIKGCIILKMTLNVAHLSEPALRETVRDALKPRP